MQSLEFTVAQHFDDQGPGLVQNRRVQGERIDDALWDDIASLLVSSWAPAKGEWLVFTAEHRPRYVVAGVDTIPVSRRLLRRACERLWPTGSTNPEPPRRAAFNLLQDGHAVIRRAPFGLIASRY